MALSVWWRLGWVSLVGCALWLLLAGAERVFGWDAGMLGMALLVGSAWCALYAVSRLPGEALARSASPAEWRARIGAGFTLVAIVYFLSKAHVLDDAAFPHNHDANAVARNLVLLLVAWSVLSQALASRMKGVVDMDERDREIAIQAAGWGRGPLIFCVIGIAAMLAFTPGDRLGWATPLAIGNLLVFALMWGWLCEYAATIVLYGLDRRAAHHA
ncbi:MAG: hypothetical protein ACOY82_11325 [Pseudomonadota bacterium]